MPANTFNTSKDIMKKLTLICLLSVSYLFAYCQTVPGAPADKAVVYFARPSGLGALVNFTFFDDETAIGRFNGGKYMRYTCEPGAHLFWARSENKSYVKANLEAGKMYVIEALPQMGGFKAGVRLIPVNPLTYKMKFIQKLVTKRSPVAFTPQMLAGLQVKMKEVIKRGKEKYAKMDSDKIPLLLANMTIEPSGFTFVKKKK